MLFTKMVRHGASACHCRLLDTEWRNSWSNMESLFQPPAKEISAAEHSMEMFFELESWNIMNYNFCTFSERNRNY